AKALADLLAEIDVETNVFIGVFRIDRFIARRMRVDRVYERLALPGRIFGLKRLTTSGRRLRLSRNAKRYKARTAQHNIARSPGEHGIISEIAQVLENVF